MENNLKTHNILLVDDRPENLFSLESMLNQEGIHPQKADAIKARLKQIESQMTPPGKGGAVGGKYYTRTVQGEY